MKNSTRQSRLSERPRRQRINKMPMMENQMSSTPLSYSGTCMVWRWSRGLIMWEPSSTGLKWVALEVFVAQMNKRGLKRSISSRSGQRLRKHVSQTTSNGKTCVTLQSTEDRWPCLFGSSPLSWSFARLLALWSSRSKQTNLKKSLQVMWFAL